MLRLLFLFCIIITDELVCQSTIPQISEAQSLGFHEELPQEGTYQILLKNGTHDTIVPHSILLKVNMIRHHDNETYWPVNNNVRIRVLPYAVIRENTFVPLPKYAHEN